MSHQCNLLCRQILEERAAGASRPIWNALAQRDRTAWTSHEHRLAYHEFFKRKRLTLTKRLVRWFQRSFRPYSSGQFTRAEREALPEFCPMCGQERA